ncbi:TcpQ domain-containing protein [uncultured Desulfovibrio sp.]|uniref:toxin co-regulated pilus biosynthesis Q family protein n=1 Tax=uncultured Desulfovibrio sp. TaxID=167968 RepID=UPI0028055C4F|nr:TcpQ domain-containing protein [uncultured Desulfovibrio sp.]
MSDELPPDLESQEVQGVTEATPEAADADAQQQILPDGIGLSVDDVSAMLHRQHGISVPKDDPLLMQVTIHNAFLTEQQKLQKRHEKALAAFMGEQTNAHVEAVKNSVGQLTETLSGVPVKDFCRWNGVGTSAVLEEGYQVYLSEPPAGTIPTAAPVPVPPGAAALEAQAMQTELTAAASMPQAIPVPAQTVLPTTTQTSPKLSLEKPNPGEMTHYVPSAPLSAPVPAVAEEVSAEPPAVIETVSVSAEPVSLPSWQVERGRMLREQMENWAAQTGYTLIWSAQNDYEMQSSATFSGVFIEAVKNLFAALASNGLALRVTIYQGNNVMEVSEH